MIHCVHGYVMVITVFKKLTICRLPLKKVLDCSEFGCGLLISDISLTLMKNLLKQLMKSLELYFHIKYESFYVLLVLYYVTLI